MNNIEHYERMIYLDENEVELILAALIDTWYHWGAPDDENAMKLHDKIAQHYHIKLINRGIIYG